MRAALPFRRETVPLDVIPEPLRRTGRRHGGAAEQRLPGVRATLEADLIATEQTLFDDLGIIEKIA